MSGASDEQIVGEPRKVVALLEYGWAETGGVKGRRWWSFLPYVPAAVAVFVSFTWNVSPVECARALLGMMWRGEFTQGWIVDALGLPFFLAIPILALRIRVDVVGPMRRWERIAGYAMGFLAAALLVALTLTSALARQLDRTEWLCLSSLPLVLGIGAFAWARLTIRGDPGHLRVWVVMVCPYLANGLFCLLLFYQATGLGWYLTVPGVLAAGVEMGLILRAAGRRGG